MNATRLCLAAAALAVGMGHACSQQEGSDGAAPFEVPSEPTVHPAPAFSQWIITLTYPEEQQWAKIANASGQNEKPLPEALASRPRTVVTTKTNQIIHEDTISVGGKRSENWQINGAYYIKYPGKTIWSAYEKPDAGQIANGSAIILALPASGFRDLDWITPAAYAGKIKVAGSEQLVFVPGGRKTLNPQDPTKQKELESTPTLAYVDAGTRLPIMIRTPNATRQFKFTNPAPTSVQTLPADLADEIKAGDQIRAKRNAAPQKEY